MRKFLGSTSGYLQFLLVKGLLLRMLDVGILVSKGGLRLSWGESSKDGTEVRQEHHCSDQHRTALKISHVLQQPRQRLNISAQQHSTKDVLSHKQCM